MNQIWTENHLWHYQWSHIWQLCLSTRWCLPNPKAPRPRHHPLHLPQPSKCSASRQTSKSSNRNSIEFKQKVELESLRSNLMLSASSFFLFHALLHFGHVRLSRLFTFSWSLANGKGHVAWNLRLDTKHPIWNPQLQVLSGPTLSQSSLRKLLEPPWNLFVETLPTRKVSCRIQGFQFGKPFFQKLPKVEAASLHHFLSWITCWTNLLKQPVSPFRLQTGVHLQELQVLYELLEPCILTAHGGSESLRFALKARKELNKKKEQIFHFCQLSKICCLYVFAWDPAAHFCLPGILFELVHAR